MIYFDPKNGTIKLRLRRKLKYEKLNCRSELYTANKQTTIFCFFKLFIMQQLIYSSLYFKYDICHFIYRIQLIPLRKN